ncbi:methylmalonyl Co-A mutase-associated GTPase MeaB [Bacillus sp. V5-8f]|uniref:methylmalonyl Co-A mutase-associated GTPase MeaB n=1 Tax=Bacillus sp. V5-8f TaxID=2053044 RepID=UPI000C7906CA|nr:methylmalonyl Co-A mutase-associated GTPase MeaB [Bacillus sp. V5-8f]PLT34777.1 methylmalonyl Co-A mutase-associated GTPase MeaB [Bacillus sp. V5-8f]
MDDGKKPEWAEGMDSAGFASVVKKGVDGNPITEPKRTSRFIKPSKRTINLNEIKKGLLQGDRPMLAKAITLIESNAPHHFDDAQQLLQTILPYSGHSVRIGISGVPGAGKSTFIESFGTFLCSLGHNVAVLAVDPSSSVGGGSILGDKTRMEGLARNPKAFIRPSPSGGTLGGVHRKTRETIVVCEAAGFDIILIETVGVGQSESMVRSMSDFFMLLALTGAGDELQGMKKGIMELVDAVIVNKADGQNRPLALKTKAEYSRILHFLQPATKGWPAKAYACSSLTGDGISELWDAIGDFVRVTKESGAFDERRRTQSKEWMYSLIHDSLHNMFFKNGKIKDILPVLENQVASGNKTVAKAVQECFEVFHEAIQNGGLTDKKEKG